VTPVNAGEELYRRGNGSLVVRERGDGGIDVETHFPGFGGPGGVRTVIALDAFQARDLLRGLLRGSPSYSLSLSGPAER
jgi:hypothetical protein